MKSKDLLLFLILTFAIGWLFQGLADVYGFQSHGKLWLTLAMWAPMAAALLTSRDTRSQLWSRVKRAGWLFWPIALLAGWSFCAGQQILLVVVRQGHWNTDMFRLSINGHSIDSIHHLGMALGAGSQGFVFFALNLVLSVFLGSVISVFVGAIGEEAGWRGILQPEMERRFGTFKGTLLVGLIWGYWHLPANLVGYNDPRHPILGAVLIFPLVTISMAFVLAWLLKRSGSVWPASLAHGANNTLFYGMLILPDNWFTDQWTSVAVAILVGALFAWLLVRGGVHKQPSAFADPGQV